MCTQSGILFLKSSDPEHSLTLRPVNENDVYRLYYWRNDPWLVSLALTQKKVHWLEHKRWFYAKIHSPNTRIYVIRRSTKNDVCVQEMGVLRLERLVDVVNIGIYLLRPYTQKGYGRCVIEAAKQIAKSHWPNIRCCEAVVKKHNRHSHVVFVNSGFTQSQEDAQKTVYHCHQG